MRKLHDSWKPILTPEFKAPYFLDLVDFIKRIRVSDMLSSKRTSV